MILTELFIFSLIILVVIGTLVVPELRTYSTQVVALLLLFYLILEKLRKKQQRTEVRREEEDEETLLFLTTYLKPKLTSLIDLSTDEENLELLKKQLQLTEREVEQFLEQKEKEADL